MASDGDHQQPPSLAALTLDQLTMAARPGALQSVDLTASHRPQQSSTKCVSDDRIGWWRTQSKANPQPATGPACPYDYGYYDDDGDGELDESSFMAYQYGYVNETQVSSNVECAHRTVSATNSSM